MTARRPDGWWYPWIFVAGFLVVIAVNGTMLFFATSTFSGLSVERAFERGNAYNAEIAAERAQAARGFDFDVVLAARGGGVYAAEIALPLKGQWEAKLIAERAGEPPFRLRQRVPVPPDSSGGAEFCCAGCRAAFDLVRGLGLESYYRRRVCDPGVRPLRPDDAPELDLTPEAVPAEEPGAWTLHAVVDGLHCAACVWLIETLLRRHPAVVSARLNMTTRRLTLVWRGEASDAT